eukprot:378231_1
MANFNTTNINLSTTEHFDAFDEGWNWTKTVAVIFVAVAFVIYLPLTFYFMYPLFKARKELIFQKRYSTLTLYGIYSQIFSITIFSLFQLILYNVFNFNMNDPPDVFFVLIIMFLICVQFIAQFFYGTLFLRLWLTYYDIKYNMVVGSNEWKSIIDENYNAKKSWFVKCRRTLGNQRILFKIMLIFCVVTVIIDIILASIDWKNDGRTDYCVQFWFWGLVFNFFGYCLSSSIIYCLLRKVKYFDDLHILKEFLMFYKIIMTIVLSYILYFFILGTLITMVDESLAPLLGLITLYFLYQSWMLFHILATYIFTRWVFKQLQNDSALQAQYSDVLKQLSYHFISNNRQKPRMELMQMSSPNVNTNTPNENKPRPSELMKQIPLMQILSRMEYLCSFMQHLSHEFSMECLLSLIEMIQFRTYCEEKLFTGNDTLSVKHNSNHKASGSHDIYEVLSNIKLPLELIKSSIVYSKEYDYNEKARKLFEKYIVVGAEYEININGKRRMTLTERFQRVNSVLRSLSVGKQTENNNKIEKDELSSSITFVFDRCCDDMLRLLGYSLSRFKKKPQYLKLLNFDSNQ